MSKGFALTAKQKEAVRVISGHAMHTMLYGGSRSGKTFLFCYLMATRAIAAPHSRHAILRYRFNQVKQSVALDTFPKMMRLCYPQLKYSVDKSDWYAKLPNESEIWFGGLDDKERTEKILGMEFATIFLNECSQISWYAREMVLTRLAQKVMVKVEGMEKRSLKLRMFYDCNPPSKGHWTYRLFVRKIDTQGKLIHKPDNFTYFQINPTDNRENISEGYLETLEGLSAAQRKRFLDGDFTEETENALFNDISIEMHRVHSAENLPDMVRIVVAVDPSGAGDMDNENNDEIGLVVCGLGTDGKGYLLEDITVKASPAVWGKVAVNAYERHEANAIVAEMNFGGAMVEHVIRTSSDTIIPFVPVTASRGKQVRAEPIAALYEQGRIRHAGHFEQAESEMVAMTTAGYIGSGSPNRLDAIVWGFTELFGGIVNGKRNDKPFERRKVRNTARWAA